MYDIRPTTNNIAEARTTDPEIYSVTWTKFDNHMAPLALVANLATKGRLQRKKRDYVGKIPKWRTPPHPPVWETPVIKKKSWVYFSF